jgi:hypothetical protein
MLYKSAVVASYSSETGALYNRLKRFKRQARPAEGSPAVVAAHNRTLRTWAFFAFGPFRVFCALGAARIVGEQQRNAAEE